MVAVLPADSPIKVEPYAFVALFPALSPKNILLLVFGLFVDKGAVEYIVLPVTAIGRDDDIAVVANDAVPNKLPVILPFTLKEPVRL